MAHVNLQSHGLFNLPSKGLITWRGGRILCEHWNTSTETWGLTKAGVYFAVFRTNDDTVRVFTSQWPMHDIFSIADKEKQSKKPSSWGTQREIFKASTQFQKTYFFTRLYWFICPSFETSEISASTTIQWSGIQIYTVGSVDYLVSVSGKMLLLNFLSVIFHCC